MTRALACASLALLCTGCFTTREYVVARDADRAIPFAATGAKDGRAVRVDPRRATVTVKDAPDGAHLRVVARGRNNMVLAGNLLVWIGTPISIVGTALYLAQASGELHTTGLIMAPSAEPLMITGTVLWVVGLIRPPWEAR